MPPGDSLLGLDHAGLRSALAGTRAPSDGAAAVWDAIHRRLVASPDQLPAPWGPALLERGFTFTTPRTCTEVPAGDGLARKWLLEVDASTRIEAVLMAHVGSAPEGSSTARERFTLCVSSQAGCAVGCVFCATGQMGFQRNLSAGEIVGQALHAQRHLAPAGHRLRNIVFMGMGEPLHNLDAVLQAATILTDPRGLALAPRHLTVSTIGIVPGIRRLTALRSPLRLAVSLHAADDSTRATLVPSARRWPLAELLDACAGHAARLRRKVLFEWTLISGTNDSPDHARAVASLLSNLPAHLNVIPLNPTRGYDGRPSADDAVRAFCRIVQASGTPTTIRQRRGIDVGAGCGQLSAPRAAPARPATTLNPVA